MIYSMTAFGRAQKEESGYSILIEIRALNSRSLDIVVRLPKNYLEFEEMLRKQISQSVRRGRIEVFVQVESTAVDQKAPQINQTLAHAYWEQLQSLHRSLPGTDPPNLQHLLGIPYLFQSNGAEEDRDALRELLSGTLADALDQIREMRLREGEALLEDCLARLALLRRELASVESRKDLVLEEYQTRLRDRVQELLGNVEIDGNRLLQEVAYFAERSDINEEIARLHSHLNQVEELLTGRQTADGRRLDFLIQELHREVNTIGCKTGDLDAIQSVVLMKGEIGKLKEQIQNVE